MGEHPISMNKVSPRLGKYWAIESFIFIVLFAVQRMINFVITHFAGADIMYGTTMCVAVKARVGAANIKRRFSNAGAPFRNHAPRRGCQKKVLWELSESIWIEIMAY